MLRFGLTAAETVQPEGYPFFLGADYFVHPDQYMFMQKTNTMVTRRCSVDFILIGFRVEKPPRFQFQCRGSETSSRGGDSDRRCGAVENQPRRQEEEEEEKKASCLPGGRDS